MTKVNPVTDEELVDLGLGVGSDQSRNLNDSQYASNSSNRNTIKKLKSKKTIKEIIDDETLNDVLEDDTDSD